MFEGTPFDDHLTVFKEIAANLDIVGVWWEGLCVDVLMYIVAIICDL